MFNILQQTPLDPIQNISRELLGQYETRDKVDVLLVAVARDVLFNNKTATSAIIAWISCEVLFSKYLHLQLIRAELLLSTRKIVNSL